MQTNDLKDLLEAVEAIRKEIHADLDRGFLAAVVQAEEQNPEDDAEAIRAIQEALKAALAVRGGA